METCCKPTKLFAAELRNISDAGEGPMVTNLTGRAQIEGQIEDLGNHPADTLAALRGLLTRGANLVADPKRKEFFEVESDSVVYYIYVSPVSGKVLLLATWQNEAVTSGAGGVA